MAAAASAGCTGRLAWNNSRGGAAAAAAGAGFRVAVSADGYGMGTMGTDFPDSDLNFSFRLQQLTSLKVNPNPIHRRLTAPDLCDYPFIYMIEPGRGSRSRRRKRPRCAISAQRRFLDGRRFLGRQ